MTDPAGQARALFTRARERHATGDVAGGIELARRALALDPDFIEALEHLATVLITRRAQYDEGVALIERAVSLRADDAGLWYALGWCCEFAAHEIRRRPPRRPHPDARTLYERSGEAFRTYLSLNPDAKLAGDAEDLLDHVENVLLSL